MRRPEPVVLLVAGTLLAGCGTAERNITAPTTPTAVEADGTVFERAYETCDPESRITVGDAGTSITMDGPASENFAGRTTRAFDRFIADAACILTALDTPEFVISQIDSTTSLQGLREANWDDIHAEWSFHPDNGLDMVLVFI